MHFIQTWEEDIPSSVVLSEAEESAIVVMAELMGINRGMVYSGMQYAALTHRYKEIREEAETERGDDAFQRTRLLSELEWPTYLSWEVIRNTIRSIQAGLQKQAEIAAKYRNEKIAAEEQLGKLAHFLVTNARGPLPKADNWSECAIQVIKDLLAEVDQLKAQLDNR